MPEGSTEEHVRGGDYRRMRVLKEQESWADHILPDCSLQQNSHTHESYRPQSYESI